MTAHAPAAGPAWTRRRDHRAAGEWLARPSWLAAATVVCVGLPAGHVSSGEGLQVTPGDYAGFALVLAAGLLVITGRAAVPRAAFLAFGPLVVALGVTTVCSTDIDASLPGYVRNTQLFVLVPLAVVLLVRDRRDLGIVCGAVLALGLGEAAYGIWQAATGTGASIGGRNVRAVGTFGSLDVMAMSTIACFAILILTAFALVAPARGTAVLLAAIGGLGVLAVALALALSRGSWISLGAAVVLTLVTFDRWVAVRTLTCCAALLVVAVAGAGAGQAVVARSTSIVESATSPDRSVNDRYNLWGAAERIWEDHPLTGVGVKNFPSYRDTYATIELSSGSETDDSVNGYIRQPLLSPHNEYLLILSEQGVIGFAGFAALVGVILHGLWTRRSPRDPFWLIGLASMSFLLINFLYADLGGPTCVLMAVLLGVAASRALGLAPGGQRPEHREAA